MIFETKKIKLSDIKTNPDNPRTITKKQMSFLIKSLQEFPEMMQLREIVVDENMMILGGNMRYRALKQMKEKECIVKIVRELTPEQKREFIIKDNGSWGEWNMDALANTWKELPLTDWGVNLPEDWLVSEKGEVQEDDFDAEAEAEAIKEPVTKTGDIWLLGKHRVMCGDSTKKEDVGRLMGDTKADIVLTDPPYGINLLGKTNKIGGDGRLGLSKEYRSIKNDETVDVARHHIDLIKEYADEMIIFGGNYFTEFLPPTRCWLIWDKKRPEGLSFCGVEMAWTSFDQHPKLYEWLWDGGRRKGDRNTELKTRVHPTQKPVGLISNIMMDFSGNIIVDGFLGSGTTLIAAEQLGRICYGMEIDPIYCDVIVKRWETFTGKKAELYAEK